MTCRVLSLFLLVWFCLLLWAGSVLADTQGENLDASKERLAEIEKQIEATIRDLREKRSEVGELTDDLGRLDRETRRLKAATRRTHQEMSALDERLITEQEQLQDVQAALSSMEQRVRKRLVALYKSGEDGMVMALLKSTSTPLETAEKYIFLTRMIEHDRQLVTDYRTRSEQKRQSLEELEALRARKQSLVQKQRQQEKTLEQAGRTKRRLLASVREDAQLLDSVLAELRAKAARLNNLVKKLETDQVQTYTGEISDFTKQMGRLEWPIDGTVRVGYGSTRHPELGTMLESNGLEIEASVGTPVRTIWAGKILYASRLRGYGKLMVIDHGSKYYSLYAHVDRFNKKVGDRVAPGDVIAYSGFEGRDSLYFEVRHGGAPLDPQKWLKPR